MKPAAAFGSIALAAALVAGALVWAGFWSPAAARYVTGVDVSRHQGPIDWTRLAGTDVRFAYIKATEGGDHVDPLFLANWEGAAAAGLARGAYHFFTLCRPGADQAAHFARVVPRDLKALPPVVDLEHMGPCRKGPTMTDVAGEVRVYLAAVERAFGVRPILYTDRKFNAAHLDAIEGERFWVRSLHRWPDYRRREWIIWQRDNRAARAGVKGPVDINSFRGDARAFAEFITRS